MVRPAYRCETGKCSLREEENPDRAPAPGTGSTSPIERPACEPDSNGPSAFDPHHASLRAGGRSPRALYSSANFRRSNPPGIIGDAANPLLVGEPLLLGERGFRPGTVPGAVGARGAASSSLGAGFTRLVPAGGMGTLGRLRGLGTLASSCPAPVIRATPGLRTASGIRGAFAGSAASPGLNILFRARSCTIRPAVSGALRARAAAVTPIATLFSVAARCGSGCDSSIDSTIFRLCSASSCRGSRARVSPQASRAPRRSPARASAFPRL